MLVRSASTTSEAASAVGDWAEWQRFRTGELSARIADEMGGEVIVFPDDAIGGNGDLWVARVEDERRVGSSMFLGVSIRDEVNDALEVSGRIDGDSLIVWPSVARDSEQRIRFADVSRDSDGDGLPDLVETRIRTNAHAS